MRGDRREVASYFTEEVLDGQPQRRPEFLLETSVLSELTPDLCRLVRGRDDAGGLARASREGRLVVPLGERSHYRYHHLFAEMLEGELARGARAGRRSRTILVAAGTRSATSPTRRCSSARGG